MGIKAWIEEHPYLTGGAVLGLIVLYFLLTSGSSNSSSGQTTTQGGLSSADQATLQSQQIQTGAALQAQQNQATEQSNQLSAELAATQINANAGTTANQLAAQVQLQNILTAGQVQNYSTQTGYDTSHDTNQTNLSLNENNNSTQVALANMQIGGQVQLAGISAQENEYAVGTQASTLQAEYDAATKSQGIISDAQTQQAQINANTQQQIANYAAQTQIAGYGVQIAGINASADVTNNQTAAQLAAYTTGSNNQAAVDLGAINAYGNVINSGLNYIKGANPNAEQVSFLNTLFGQPSTVTGSNFKASTGSGASTVAAQNPPSQFGITIPGFGSFGASL